MPPEEADHLRAIQRAIISYNELQFHCQYIAAAAAKRFSSQAPFDMLYQEANLAIQRSIKRYEIQPPELGLSILDYVSKAVTRHLQRVLEEEIGMVRISHHAVEALSNLKKWEHEFAQANNRWPTANDIIEGLGISMARLQEMRLLSRLMPTAITATDQMIEMGIEPAALGSAFDDLIDTLAIRSPLDQLMDADAISNAQKVILSLIYGIHFPQLAGIKVHNFTYPLNPSHLPLPNKGILSPTQAGKILGMGMTAVSLAHSRALDRARQFLSEQGLTSADDIL